MMDEEHFWSIVEATRAQAVKTPRPKTRDIIDVHIGTLTAALARLAPAQVVAFAERFYELNRRAYRWDLWGAAYWIGGGCGDDGFMDFRSTLISLGREIYERALADPDGLARIIGVRDAPYMQSEGFQYVAGKVYKQQTGRELNEVIHSAPHPKNPIGEKWDFDDEEAMAERFPQLVAKLPEGGD